MKNIPYFLLIVLLISVNSLSAQDLKLYDIEFYEKKSGETVAFTSLSDNYRISDHADSLAIPDVSEMDVADAEYFTLDTIFRERFLSGLQISDKDSLFVYNYHRDVMASFAVKELKVVARLSVYASTYDWPFAHYDYMIGFEIKGKPMGGLVYVGKENPFVQGQMRPVGWKEMAPKDIPDLGNSLKDTLQLGKYVSENIYSAKDKDVPFFIQDMNRENYSRARRLLVINLNTEETLLDKMFYDGESASSAPLNFVNGNENDITQWTGKLFKNKPPVVFGFQYHSFGCPSISFLDKAEKDIYINCDNRH